MLRKHLVLALMLTLGLAGQVTAESLLVADKSDIRFISVKNAAIAEVHHFRSLSGSIDGDEVQVVIPLVDVETLIPIRNERMQKMLFETDSFPKATLSGSIDMAAVMALENGGFTEMAVNLVLDLHGKQQPISTTVGVSRLGDEIHVSTGQPIILNAASFGLTPGIERLREVAGLQNIATQVPVTANLVFKR